MNMVPVHHVQSELSHRKTGENPEPLILPLYKKWHAKNCSNAKRGIISG
jgi:hypothetical protein